jgi:hypothetical protein
MQVIFRIFPYFSKKVTLPPPVVSYFWEAVLLTVEEGFTFSYFSAKALIRDSLLPPLKLPLKLRAPVAQGFRPKASLCKVQ